ncbi:MAG: type IV pilus biogenesis/stability protein PilW [Chromatiales bacterium]|nr:type IV pilus biogenesis/stability protein PilW [Chromatiales bacterium]
MSRFLRVAAFGLIVLALGACQTNQPSDEISSRDTDHALAKTYQELAVAYMQQGAAEIALAQIQRSLAIDPKFGMANNVAGMIYQRLNQNELAEEYFLKAVEFDPANPYIRNAVGAFYCAQKRYDKATEQFDAALRNPLYREPEVALSNSGLCALQAGDSERGERLLRESLVKKPTQPRVLLQMAKLSFEKGIHLSTRAYLQRYEQVAQPTAASLWLGIRAERELNDTDAVARYAEQLVQRFPDSDEAQRYFQSLSRAP